MGVNWTMSCFGIAAGSYAQIRKLFCQLKLSLTATPHSSLVIQFQNWRPAAVYMTNRNTLSIFELKSINHSHSNFNKTYTYGATHPARYHALKSRFTLHILLFVRTLDICIMSYYLRMTAMIYPRVIPNIRLISC